MITSKQRAYLRGMASTAETIFQLGKEGIGETFVKQIDLALEKRELIKLKILETAPIDAREAAEQLAHATRSNIVQVIGHKVVLYRAASEVKNRKIVLPR